MDPMYRTIGQRFLPEIAQKNPFRPWREGLFGPILYKVSRRTQVFLGVAGLAVWAAATGFALHRAMSWESTAGLPADHAPVTVPKGEEFSLVLVAHAECPCTRATLANLKSIGDVALARLHPIVVLTGPGATPGSKSTNVELAETLPHSHIVFCDEAKQLKLYGARTSGQCFLYDANGRLLFSGGLTAGRGNEGQSAGMEALHNRLAGKPSATTAPVYGCALTTPEAK